MRGADIYIIYIVDNEEKNMGNVQGVHCWDEGEKGSLDITSSSNGGMPPSSRRRPLPSARQDFHWLHVGFDQLFDPDYLNKESRAGEQNGGGFGMDDAPSGKSGWIDFRIEDRYLLYRLWWAPLV